MSCLASIKKGGKKEEEVFLLFCEGVISEKGRREKPFLPSILDPWRLTFELHCCSNNQSE